MKKRSTILIAAIIFFSLSAAGNATSIDGVLNNAKKEGKAVMLELGSVGCIPCEQMKAVMEKLRTNYSGKLEVVFVDISRDREAARRFHVFAIPTQVFLDKNGKEFHRHMGFYGYEEIVPVLKKAGL
jgi:thioredoxin 1